MKYLARLAPIIGILFLSHPGYADSIADTYAAGDTLTATMLNSIKSAINDNDSRLSVVESSMGLGVDFTDFGTPFAPDGAPKNVVTLKQASNNGSYFYHVRTFYANSTQQISIGGVLNIPGYMANYIAVSYDSNDTLIGISNWIEGSNTPDFADVNIEESSHDLNTLAKTIGSDNRRATNSCQEGGAIRTCEVTNYTNNLVSGRRGYSYVSNMLGPGAVNSIPFSQMRGVHRDNSSVRYEVHAKDIGLVLRQKEDGPPMKIIYHRVNGNTGGSLTGTPFEAGQLLNGFFF